MTQKKGSNDNIQEHLKQLHQLRKATTSEKVNSAIECLIDNDEKINFCTVAKRAGVSKATLYNHKEISDRIHQLRMQQSQNCYSIKQLKQEKEDKNRQQTIQLLKRKVKMLQTENTLLRKQLRATKNSVK